jgi:hypothetical protein
MQLGHVVREFRTRSNEIREQHDLNILRKS